jgi:hypothetical protein
MNQDTNLIVDEIKRIIEKKLLVDTSQLENNDDLEIALGIDPEIDLPLLVSDIGQKYSISTETKSLLRQATTLKQLASIVIEETELG